MKSTMTDEIAFKLGKFDFPHFYQFAQWKVNKEPFELVYFFDWSLPGGIGGWPCKNEEGYPTDWENISASGKLKSDLIKEISHKISYIRGRLDSYSVKIAENEICVCYANSHDFRDLLANCLHDVIFDKFCLAPLVEGVFGRRCISAPDFNIEKGETVGTIPATPYVRLKADKKIINYILGK